MSTPDVEDSWEYYLTWLEDTAASVSFNLGLEPLAPVGDAPHLFLVRVAMDEPGEHGLGTAAEADRFAWFEDELTARAGAEGLHFAGCLRTMGRWEMGLYGPTGTDIKALLDSFVPADQNFEVTVERIDDPTWRFYREFLLPDRERWQWIRDRRVIMQLELHGDDGSVPRPVDHVASFVDEASRETFTETAAEAGYRVWRRSRREDCERPFVVEIQRDDVIDLEAIHEAVEQLIELVDALGGEYEGWSTSLVDCAG
jgi:regulator of RNase E activity RraB